MVVYDMPTICIGSTQFRSVSRAALDGAGNSQDGRVIFDCMCYVDSCRPEQYTRMSVHTWYIVVYVRYNRMRRRQLVVSNDAARHP